MGINVGVPYIIRMYQVIYFSRGGNTKKVADAIAKELDVRAEDVKEASLRQETGMIFLGSGCYGGKPDKGMMRFIEENEFKGRKVVLFGTSGGGEGEEVDEMKRSLEAKGAEIEGSFNCKGQTFWLINRGRPNGEDLERAKKFAERITRE